ncbi:gluconokinase [Micromonospora mangrovi]|uniref:Gluconokinase n=2 Tax=Micromonospora TaxID=1873 RepID=A0AAU7MGF9_9ACTN
MSGPSSLRPAAAAGVDPAGSDPVLARSRVVILAGVSGSGKSVVGAALAGTLGLPFADGDAFHPPRNVAKMSAGQPLTDTDRWPWLDAIGTLIDQWRATGQGGVVACSALRRVYRDRLSAGRPEVVFAFLDVPWAVLVHRVANRTGHFMPTSLLASQLAALEPPHVGEPTVRVLVGERTTVQEQVTAIVTGIAGTGGAVV